MTQNNTGKSFSFGDKQPNYEIVRQQKDNSSPESNVTPCFNSVSHSESPERQFKFSWHDSHEDNLPITASVVNDSFCQAQKKLDLIEQQRKELYEQATKKHNMIPIRIEEGQIILVNDKFENLSLPFGIGEFRLGEAVVMTVQHSPDKFYDCSELQKELKEDLDDVDI